jgi:hypothetical protein
VFALSPLSALVLACAAAGWALSRRIPEHAPVAAAISWSLVSDLGRAALQELALQDAPVPFTEAARAAFHLEQALYLSWPAALAGAALLVYRGRSPWPAAAAWALSCVVLALAYPWLRAERLAFVHAVLWTAAMAAVAALAWRRLRGAPQRALALLASGATAVIVVVLWSDSPVANWNVARIVQTVAFAIVLVYQVAQASR